MPVWQAIYEEINDPNFVIICAAEDTGGEAVAGPIFDAANPTYIQVVDEDHLISSVFNFVNVPSAAWIDEEGRIVRIDEGTYSKVHQFGEGDQAFTFGTDVIPTWDCMPRRYKYASPIFFSPAVSVSFIRRERNGLSASNGDTLDFENSSTSVRVGKK